MPEAIRFRLLIVLIFFLFLSSLSLSDQRERALERGELSVFFMGEMVGYEEYTWEESRQGYRLTVRGRMTKPVAVEVERLQMDLDRSFIPLRYSFKGTMGGVEQEVSSVFSEGSVVNTIHVNRQEQRMQRKVRRDALLLPNPFYSPYIVITKKYRCTMEEKKDLSAYIIPQLETSFTLEPSEDDPCLLLMKINNTLIELETNEFGHLIILQIPAQNLRVTSIVSLPH